MKSFIKTLFLFFLLAAAIYGSQYYYYNYYLEVDPAIYYTQAMNYSQGIGVDKDEKKGFALLVKSANLGYIDAQVKLAWTLHEGKVVDKNEEKAANWYRKAAEQDNAEAQYMLGYMFDNAIGVPKNDISSTYWFDKAANNGNQNAQLFLGALYAKANDPQNAYAWLNLAATTSNPAIRNKALELRDGIAKDMTAEEVQAAQALTVEHVKFIRAERARKYYENLKWYDKPRYWYNYYKPWK